MEYATLGGTGTTVSRLCLGCYGFGSGSEWMLDPPESTEIVERAIDHGINFFDTANRYSRGESEVILGDALAGYDRDAQVIATKLGMPMSEDPNSGGLSRKTVEQQIRGSLERLGVETIDLYQAHRWDDDTPVEETVRALDDCVRRGQARSLGASSMWAHQFQAALHASDSLGLERFATMQNHYSLVYREEEREMLPLCEREDVGVFPWGPLAHGFLARLHSNRSRWWETIRNGRMAIKYMQKVETVAPKRGDYVFGSGLYDYYVDILSEEYTLSNAILWMLPDGNKKRGLRFLHETATNGRYVKTEAIYFLAKVHYLYEDDFRDSRKWVSKLRERHPDNPFFHTFQGRVYARWGRWDKAREIFRAVLKRCEVGQAGYNTHMEEVARLYLARDRLYQDQYQDALRHLGALEQLTSRSIEVTRYRMLGYLYQGMAYDALGEREQAVKRYERVLGMEDAAGAHERAERYLDSPYEG